MINLINTHLAAQGVAHAGADGRTVAVVAIAMIFIICAATVVLLRMMKRPPSQGDMFH